MMNIRNVDLFIIRVNIFVKINIGSIIYHLYLYYTIPRSSKNMLKGKFIDIFKIYTW